MTKYQRSLMNCYCSLMKEWFNIYNYREVINSYELLYDGLKIYTNKNNISWEFLEKIKDITDKSNISWSIYAKDHELVIQLQKY